MSLSISLPFDAQEARGRTGACPTFVFLRPWAFELVLRIGVGSTAAGAEHEGVGAGAAVCGVPEAEATGALGEGRTVLKGTYRNEGPEHCNSVARSEKQFVTRTIGVIKSNDHAGRGLSGRDAIRVEQPPGRGQRKTPPESGVPPQFFEKFVGSRELTVGIPRNGDATQ